MSGETASHESGWTVDTLKDHVEILLDEWNKRLDERFESQEKAVTFALTEREKAVSAALTAAKEAVTKAEDSSRETLKSHNDLIRQSRDRDATYATRESMEDYKTSNSERLGRLERFQYIVTGATMLALALGLATLVKVFTG